jgi:hypothetical protein
MQFYDSEGNGPQMLLLLLDLSSKEVVVDVAVYDDFRCSSLSRIVDAVVQRVVDCRWLLRVAEGCRTVSCRCC